MSTGKLQDLHDLVSDFVKLKSNFCLKHFLLSPQALCFISFVCFAASAAAAFVTVPLLEFLAAVFLLFAYSTKFNEKFKGFCWPLTVGVNHIYCNVLQLYIKRQRLNNAAVSLCFLSKDFMRCVTASIIFFIVSIMAVSKYADGSSKAAGVRLILASSCVLLMLLPHL